MVFKMLTTTKYGVIHFGVAFSKYMVQKVIRVYCALFSHGIVFHFSWQFIKCLVGVHCMRFGMCSVHIRRLKRFYHVYPKLFHSIQAHAVVGYLCQVQDCIFYAQRLPIISTDLINLYTRSAKYVSHCKTISFFLSLSFFHILCV